MKIEFDNIVRKNLSNEKIIKRSYGRMADKIIIRLSMLQAANCLADIPNIPPTERHKLSGNYKGCWGISIEKNWRIVIRPIGTMMEPMDIKEIIIVDIVDYH